MEFSIPLSKKSEPLFRQVYKGLRKAILSGAFPAGGRLPTTVLTIPAGKGRNKSTAQIRKIPLHLLIFAENRPFLISQQLVWGPFDERYAARRRRSPAARRRPARNKLHPFSGSANTNAVPTG
jgi:hypothetical protein